jgi:hypothetical protein
MNCENGMRWMNKIGALEDLAEARKMHRRARDIPDEERWMDETWWEESG